MNESDVPERGIDQDRLDRAALVTNISGLLVEKVAGAWKSRETVVGLTAKWGSGKSTVLNFIENYLQAFSGIAVVRFDPWLITGQDDLVDLYFREMTHQLGRSSSDKARELAGEFENYREAIGAIADFALPYSSKLINLIPRTKKKTLRERRAQLETKLRALQGALVVIVDELDRVEDGDIRELARFIKAVGDLPSISYLIGYDPRRVQRALSRGTDDSEGEEYLKKIIQVNVPLRPLMDYEVLSLIAEQLGTQIIDELQNDQERWLRAERSILDVIETPRDIKRFCATFKGVYSAVGREVDIIDMAYYCVISSQSASLRQIIEDNIDEFVDDPADQRIIYSRVASSERDIYRIPGMDKQKHARFEDIIFSAFPSVRSSSRDTGFGRISRRNNLLVLLYLGNPPFRVSRSKIEGFWAAPDEGELRELDADGKFEDFAGKLEELLGDLPSAKDGEAFSAISRFLESGSTIERLSRRNSADNLRWFLCRFAADSERSAMRIRSIVSDLQSVGDLSILPEILRHHMFAFGVVPGQSPRDYPLIFNKPAFASFLTSEVARYRAFILSGGWLGGVGGAAIFYAVEQSGHWDDELRAALEAQLQQKDNILVFAGVMVPPGFSIDKGVVERFVSEEVVVRLLDRCPAEDAWFANAKARLIEGIQGGLSDDDSPEADSRAASAALDPPPESD